MADHDRRQASFGLTEMDLAARLRTAIKAEGAIPVARFMAEANAAYYAARDPLGAEGDFITAPEVSQMFGELIGLALADMIAAAGPGACYVELGPGRGTLAADALRSMARAGVVSPVHFIETSPVLRAAQHLRVPQAIWHADISSLPTDRPLLIIANEFFDALPVVQTINGRERMVRLDAETFVADAIDGCAVVERCPAAETIVTALAQRLARQGGAMIVIDYGYLEPGGRDTLQAVRAHAYVDPFTDPGEQDLTAHVDFAALIAAGSVPGVVAQGPVAQGDWLVALGIDIRADQLAKANPVRAAELTAQRMRLIHPDQMGSLFKVVGFSGPGWPRIAGLG